MLRFKSLFLKAQWLTFLVLLMPFVADAQMSLYALDRGPEAAAILIPVPAGMTAESVWNLYLQKMSGDRDLRELLPTSTLQLQQKDFKKLDGNPTEQSLFLANTAVDLEIESRLKNWTRLLSERQMKNFVLPAAMGHLFTANERRQIYDQISDNFALLLPGGGRDLAPSLYGAEVAGARNFNAKIDFYEIELIQAYIKAARGFVYATCRGLQATAVALGQEITQDIPTMIGTSIDHAEDTHGIQALKTTNQFASRLFGLGREVFIYSYHHQSVRFRAGGFLEIGALSADGVPEVLEFKNGRGFLIQSHPELTLNGVPHGDPQIAQKIFDWLIPYARKIYRFSCPVALKIRPLKFSL